jgi:hypothetical protein
MTDSAPAPAPAYVYPECMFDKDGNLDLKRGMASPEKGGYARQKANDWETEADHWFYRD